MSLAAAICLLGVNFSQGAVVYFSETFGTDAADTAAFNTQYPALSVTGPNEVSVSGGVAQILGNNANDTTFAAVSGFSSDVVISADIGAVESNGNYNVGLQIGDNSLAFHPGFTGVPGALRIEGPGGFGNSNMGFVPANNVLHHVEVVQHANGMFDLTVTDGSNPLNVFTTSWFNPGAVGGDIGIRRSGPTAGAGSVGLFDNFQITSVPEPSRAVLLVLGIASAALWRRRY